MLKMTLLATVNKILLVARFAMILVPQTGYIHPDEFFQSPEVTASDVFGSSIARTWEWQEESPSRTILFPYFSSGIPHMATKLFSHVLGFDLTTEVLLIVPRISTAAGTYLIDKSIQFLAEKVYNKGPNSINTIEIAVFLFRSSAVTLVFLTRTFSNVCETIMFSLFLWKVVSQITKKNVTDGLGSTTILLTMTVVYGFFLRPTFVFFVAFGCIAYAFICLRNGKLLSQAVLFTFTLAVSSFSIICLDSLYFSQGKEFKFIVTPLNLIKYNLKEENLQKHGLHPRYLHFLVNLPLLFGPLVLMFAFASFMLLRKPQNTPARSEIPLHKGVASLLIASAWSAVMSLSYFKHQEPRFIIPVITPICLISPWFLERYPRAWKRFLHFWCIFNAALVAWFGFVHQGGVVSCLSWLRQEVKADVKTDSITCLKYDFIFWHTYMAPKHLVSVGTDNSLTSLTVHNLGGVAESEINGLIRNLSQPSYKYYSKQCKKKIYLAVPSTVDVSSLQKFQPHLKQKFFPHLSVEASPIEYAIHQMNNVFTSMIRDYKSGLHDGEQFLIKMKSLLSLDLYKIEHEAPSS